MKNIYVTGFIGSDRYALGRQLAEEKGMELIILDKFIEELERRRQAVLEFVNEKVSRFSKIKDVEIQKEPFSKTATHKIRRFLYEKKQ